MPDLAAGQANIAGKSEVDRALIDYWIKRGVPATALPNYTMRGEASHLNLGGVDPEPSFLYWDPDKHELFPAQELPQDRNDSMLKGLDAQVQIHMQRLRLGAADSKEFARYSSGGLAFNVTQGKAGSAPTTDKSNLVWSIFSAILSSPKPSGGASAPPAGSGGSNTQSSTNKGTGAKPAKQASQGTTVLGGALSGLQGSTSSPALQPLEQVHTMQLPNGVGTANFMLFVKDRKKSLFGSLVDAFISLASGAVGAYLPLLNLGGIVQPALTSVNQLVAKLHLQEEQRLVFKNNDPIEFVANRDQLSPPSGAIRLIPGNYFVVRKGHLSLLKGKSKNVKIFDGYLIENNDDWPTYYDQAAQYISDVSYISLAITIKGNKLGSGCK